MRLPACGGTGAEAWAAVTAATAAAGPEASGALRPAAMSTWTSICSPVHSSSPPSPVRPAPPRYIVWKMCSRLASLPSTWVVTRSGSPREASRRWLRWVSTV